MTYFTSTGRTLRKRIPLLNHKKLKKTRWHSFSETCSPTTWHWVVHTIIRPPPNRLTLGLPFLGLRTSFPRRTSRPLAAITILYQLFKKLKRNTENITPSTLARYKLFHIAACRYSEFFYHACETSTDIPVVIFTKPAHLNAQCVVWFWRYFLRARFS